MAGAEGGPGRAEGREGARQLEVESWCQLMGRFWGRCMGHLGARPQLVLSWGVLGLSRPVLGHHSGCCRAEMMGQRSALALESRVSPGGSYLQSPITSDGGRW
jgi:hypothetical protein